MYAVVKTGGKQYRVAPDDVITVERLAGEAGETVALDEVLMIADEGKVSLGVPTLANTVVQAEIVEQTRGEKIIVFKKKRRKNHRRRRGHRQDLTVLRITGIETGAPARKPVQAKPAAAETDAEATKATKAPAEKTKPAAKKAAGAGTKTASAKSSKAKASPAAKGEAPAKAKAGGKAKKE